MASGRGVRSLLTVLGVSMLTALVSCSPEKVKEKPAPIVETPTPAPAVVGTDLRLVPTLIEALPGWDGADGMPARSAFLESCKRLNNRPDTARLSKRAPYGGTVKEWRSVCEAAAQLSGENTVVKAFFRDNFRAFNVHNASGYSKLTAYFEPELDAKYVPEPGFTAAIPGPPSDLVTINLSKFDEKLSRRLWGRVENGELIPYPPRQYITDEADKALGFARAGDVFYLQIQGSGRITFPDGRTLRAAFAAHNSQPFKSIARHLIDSGEITRAQAGMADIKAWLERVDKKTAQDALNINPRYVWFVAQQIDDPSKGPAGAQGAPLTPLGSMAVDLDVHPLGVPMFVDSTLPTRPGDWKGAPYQGLVIAQDTGGAIKGAVRGDFFYGWGDEAGGLAASTNHEMALYVLLPHSVADGLPKDLLIQPDE